jgi:hypothetical protein
MIWRCSWQPGRLWRALAVMHWPLVRRHRARWPLVHVAWSSAPPSTFALHHDMQPLRVQAGVDLAPFRFRAATCKGPFRSSPCRGCFVVLSERSRGSMRFVTGTLADMAARPPRNRTSVEVHLQQAKKAGSEDHGKQGTVERGSHSAAPGGSTYSAMSISNVLPKSRKKRGRSRGSKNYFISC